MGHSKEQAWIPTNCEVSRYRAVRVVRDLAGTGNTTGRRKVSLDMVENIFENGGEFCMRGDKLHLPVEWKYFGSLPADGFCIAYVCDGAVEFVHLDGTWSRDWLPSQKDLIPIPTPPQIVPWESPDDVPDGIWIRQKSTGHVFPVGGFEGNCVHLGRSTTDLQVLFDNYEYHTDRRATDGWQPCGKVVE